MRTSETKIRKAAFPGRKLFNIQKQNYDIVVKNIFERSCLPFVQLKVCNIYSEQVSKNSFARSNMLRMENSSNSKHIMCTENSNLSVVNLVLRTESHIVRTENCEHCGACLICLALQNNFKKCL